MMETICFLGMQKLFEYLAILPSLCCNHQKISKKYFVATEPAIQILVTYTCMPHGSVDGTLPVIQLH